MKFNRYFPFTFGNIDLDIYRNAEEIQRFFKFHELNGQLDLLVEGILNSVSVEGFNLIGFSVFSYLHFIFAIMLAKKIKQKTNAPIVFGGSFITLFGYFYPEVLNFVDYMIIGDGSVPLLKLDRKSVV